MTDSAPDLVARAAILIDLNRASDAVALLHRAVGVAPDNLDAWQGLARAELNRDRPREAMQAVERALAQDPGDEYSHRLASHALHQLGDHDGALRAAREAVRLAPHMWQAHRQLAEAIDDHPQPLEHRRELREEAWAAANRAMELAPLEPDTHRTVGHLHMADGAPEQAESGLREFLRLAPGDAYTLDALGRASMSSGRLVAALTDFAAAGAADPSLTFPVDNIDRVVWWATARAIRVLRIAVVTFALLFLLPVLVGRVVAVLSVIALSVGLVRVWRRVPRRLHGYLLRRRRRNLWLGATLALAAASGVVLGAAAASSSPAFRWRGAALALALLAVASGAKRLGIRHDHRRYSRRDERR